jgi:hypothetical protein
MVEAFAFMSGSSAGSHNGGSPRIYAGEIGFQAERIAWNFPSPALAAGFLLELLRGWIDFRP